MHVKMLSSYNSRTSRSLNHNQSFRHCSLKFNLHLSNYVGLTLLAVVALATTVSIAQEVTCPTFCQCADDTVQCAANLKICHDEKASGDSNGGVGAGGGGGEESGGGSGVKVTAIPNNLPNNATITSLLIARTCISRINASAFRNFQNLLRLDLNTNDIDVIEEGAFLELHKLETLTLRRNNLAGLSELTFSGLRNLKVLELSYNCMVTLGANWFRPLSNLEHLDLARNQIELVNPGAFRDLDNLSVLNLTRNKLLRLSGDFLSSLPRLEELLAGDNPIMSIANDTFVQMTSLRRLSFTGNWNMSSRSIQPEAFGAGAPGRALPLQELSLKGTSFQAVPTDFFRTLGHLESLDLSQTGLSVLGSGSFKGLINLVNLTLDSLSSLTTVESGAFQGLEKLQTLKLSNNKLLFNISHDAFFDLPSLGYLDLRNNRLETLSGGMANWSSIAVVDLRGNPFRCDCQMKWMLTLLEPRDSGVRTPGAPDSATPTTTPTLFKFGSYIQPNEQSKFCGNYSTSTATSSQKTVGEVSSAAFAREIACNSPPHLRMRCLASLPLTDFRCPNGQESLRPAEDDTDHRMKVGLIVASVTAFFLLTCAMFVKFRRRMCSVIRRQYRYKEQRDKSLNGGSPLADIGDHETTQLEDFDSDNEMNGKV